MSEWKSIFSAPVGEPIELRMFREQADHSVLQWRRVQPEPVADHAAHAEQHQEIKRRLDAERDINLEHLMRIQVLEERARAHEASLAETEDGHGERIQSLETRLPPLEDLERRVSNISDTLMSLDERVSDSVQQLGERLGELENINTQRCLRELKEMGVVPEPDYCANAQPCQVDDCDQCQGDQSEQDASLYKFGVDLAADGADYSAEYQVRMAKGPECTSIDAAGDDATTWDIVERDGVGTMTQRTEEPEQGEEHSIILYATVPERGTPVAVARTVGYVMVRAEYVDMYLDDALNAATPGPGEIVLNTVDASCLSERSAGPEQARHFTRKQLVEQRQEALRLELLAVARAEEWKKQRDELQEQLTAAKHALAWWKEQASMHKKQADTYRHERDELFQMLDWMCSKLSAATSRVLMRDRGEDASAIPTTRDAIAAAMKEEG